MLQPVRYKQAMNLALAFFVALPIVSLIFIGYRRPAVIKTTDFRFARLMCTLALALFAASPFIPPLASVVCLIFVIFALKGVFDVLAHGSGRHDD